MSVLRNSTDIIKGSKIQVWMKSSATGATAQCIGFATNHTLNVTQNFSTVNCKDAGDYELKIPSTTSWTISCDNLMSGDGFKAIQEAKKARKPVTLVFGTSNYDNVGVQAGIIDTDSTDTGAIQAGGWTQQATGATGDMGYNMTGDAYVGNYTINAPAGENATMTVQFEGTGELEAITGAIQ